jgi:hypothetical protein
VLFSITITVLLVGVAWFDFKDRSIPVLLLVGLIGLCLFRLLNQKGVGNVIDIGINCIILLINICLLVVWFKIRRKELSFFKDVFGWGDLLMLVLATLFFSPVFYILFLLGASITGLIVGFLINIFFKQSKLGIPYAGVIAIILIVVQNCNFFVCDFLS